MKNPTENVFDKILREAEEARRQRRGHIAISSALLEKAMAYRLKHGIALPFFALVK